ncbi:helix-turn-helix domain-containing protein [uncultured Clostridium sp.]|uniref:helix-turn-helix domain-containing protein n=1 Tax=uncultured Clostridium sp. TaxID=59620 RepID=UPI0026715168|nr:helix-turn-helix transcriptional regulator [uncultured Clostridium sp.]
MISDRIKDLRKELNLKQSDFANKIGIKQAAISAIEKGIRNVTDRIINDICREFNVNEEWLRNGTGEMFAPTFNDKLDQLATEYNFSKLEYTFFSSYLKLDEKKREAVTEFLESIVKQSSEIFNDEITATTDTTSFEDFKKSELEAYAQELEAEQKGITSSALEKPKGA